MEPHAIDGWVSGGVQELPGAFGIIVVGGYVGRICPALCGKNACGGSRKSAPQILEHGATINCIRKRLAYANVFQNGITIVESHVLQYRTGSSHHRQTRLLLKGDDHVRG